MALDSPYIYVSGVTETELLFNDTDTVNADLGLPDSFSQVWIQDINATFGFNGTPATLEMTLVAQDQMPATSNRIGEPCAMKVGALRFYGYITHIDSSVGSTGFSTRITCEDGRKLDMNKYLLHTEPLLECDLGRVIIVAKENETGGDLYTVNSPLWLMNNYGATYVEIYNAVRKTTDFRIPNPGVIASRLGGAEGYRWSFSMQPLFDALASIFDDCGYDIYYYRGEIKLIDRSKSVKAVDTFLDPKYKIATRDGFDQTDRPTRYTILGAKKEGGVSTIVEPVVQYENLVGLGATEFVPAWNDIEIHYHDQNGYLQKYKPADDELKMALKSIEHWVYYKKQTLGDDPTARGWMESRIDPFPYGLEGSQVESALAFGGGRDDVRRVIRNRRAVDTNWIVQWYDAVSRHARTYYGKLFYCAPSDEFKRKCLIITDAWVHDNVDNQTIDDAYSPFYADGKMSAFIKIEAEQILGYGLDGTSSPAGYTEWNEVGDYVYIPITVNLHSPSRDEDQVFPGIKETRLFVSLPEVVVTGVEDHPMLVDLITLSSFEREAGFLTGSGIMEDSFQLMLSERDYNDPKMTIKPLDILTEFFIPVQYNIRYGDDGQTTKGSTQGYYRVEIDDKFAPWTRENPEDPVPEMATKANGMISNDDYDQFYEAEVTGLPEVNFFSNFSDGSYTPVYPFTNINVTIGSNGFTSRYNSKTQLKELVRLNKIEWSRFKSRLDRIQHRANLSRLQTDMDMNLEPQRYTAGYFQRAEPRRKPAIFASTQTNPEELLEEEDIEQKSFTKIVEITGKSQHSVADPNGGPTTVIQELYQGVDDKGKTWPPKWFKVDEATSDFATGQDPYAADSQDPQTAKETVFWYQDGQWIEFVPAGADLVTGEPGPGRKRSEERRKGFAPCQDGYLRKYMTALYHQEDINGTIFCYFTGGVSLEDARLAKIVGEVQQEGDYLYADVEVLPHPLDKDTDRIRYNKVPFSSSADALFQGYGDGTIVPIMHNKLIKQASAGGSLDAGGNVGGSFDAHDPGGVRPNQTFFRDGPIGGMYIENPPVIGAFPVTVITPPEADGTGGTVAVVGTPEIQFGANVDDVSRKTVNFIGIDPELVYAGDYGILVRGLESTAGQASAAVWYCIIMKPMFTAFSAFEQTP
jgi:hypothetical protein